MWKKENNHEQRTRKDLRSERTRGQTVSEMAG